MITEIYSGNLRRLTEEVVNLPHRFGRPKTRVAYNPQIDGLRCLAILIVLIWHASLRADRHVEDLRNIGRPIGDNLALFPHGEIGVALFFVISGFVIAQPFLNHAAGEWKILRFYRRRLRRIYPPYLVCLLIMFFALAVWRVNPGNAATFNSPKFEHISLFQSVIASGFYLHNLVFDAPPRLDPPLWSLEVEMQFYLLFPFLIGLYLYPKSRATRLWIGCTAIILLIVFSSCLNLRSFGGPFGGIYRFELFSHLHLFVAGILAADYANSPDQISYQEKIMNRNRREGTLYDIVLAGGLLGLVVCGLWLAHTDAHPQLGLPRCAEAFASLFAILMVYFGATKGHVGRFIFGLSWLTFIGTFCYSIYLTHIAVVQGLSEIMFKFFPMNNPYVILFASFSVLIPAAICVGLVFYVLIERPFMNSPSSKTSSRPPNGILNAALETKSRVEEASKAST